MFDIKWIRENPKAFDEAMALRGLEPQAESLIALDEKRRAHIAKLQEAQEERNRASKEIGKAKASGDEAAAQAAIAEVAKLKSFLQGGEDEERALSAALNDALCVLPNMPYPDVPVGDDENDNVEVRVIGEKPEMDFEPKEHYELGENLGQMDFETASKLSGSRFVLLNNGLARLERALGQFMIDLHTTEHGYAEVSPPVLVREEVLYGVGNLPKFEEDLFKTTDGRWMIPTSEAPLTNIVREAIVSEDYLPRRYTALTQCFRAEAGSAGRDTRGMLRQHQFTKCELVSITDAESSTQEHERMLSCAEEVLKRLGLHYRVVTLCTGDLGFSAHKTYDIEVWLPGQNAFREISSCSVCGEFQARRMNARYRVEGDKQTRFCHTLNGSGIAVGRALIAVMENYQNADGSIRVPQALSSYMGGVTRIDPL
ncbi:MAG: serine--tRNA ligase [Rhizobiaceae bacterium]|nr:serine--tRNA ligase [Hyphomicrobiales bacterium]NRB31780.1 serine--tRNA ligase [Rhizobiaceae bacterium]